MAQAATTTTPSALPVGLDALAASVTPQVAALATFLSLATILGVAITVAAGGHLGYSLDDPYIHIAMAQRLLQGHYGINPGEVTSPSSSVIWPFLLVPTAWTPFHLHVPLAFNLALGAATAWAYGRFASSVEMPAGWPHEARARIGLAMALVLATNLVGLVYTGLEHNLQVLIAALIALALLDYCRGAAIPTWMLALAAIGPSVRYEMLAITVAVGIVLALERRWRPLAMLAAGSLALPAALAAFLVANGNFPLPNSVMTKLGAGAAAAADAGMLARIAGWIGRIATAYVTESFLAKTALLACLAAIAWSWRTASGRWRNVLAGAFLAGLLHMLAGQFGWFYRYEIYALAFCGMIAVAALSRRVPIVALAGVAVTSLAYLEALGATVHGALNIHEQHRQMHRLVTQHYRKPFAVHDLGWVSIDLAPGSYVLDLWGLASNEAVRQRDKTPAWLDDVTRRHGTGLAMFNEIAFKGIPATWTKVGELRLASKRVTAAEATLLIYATAVGDKAEIARALLSLRPTLPRGVVLDIEK